MRRHSSRNFTRYGSETRSYGLENPEGDGTSKWGRRGHITYVISAILLLIGAPLVYLAYLGNPQLFHWGSHAIVQPEDAQPGTALSLLADIPVKGRAPKTGYARENFGTPWADEDRNGCDTRNDILRRDLKNVTTKPGTRDCVVTSGTLQSPYTNETINFKRGPKTSTEVQIDHVVALSDAWQKGAQQLDPVLRQKFANDPMNLLAVDGPSNQQKGDGDAATWLPKNKAFRCQYVARQIGVKHNYHLWVTKAEREAMVKVLSACPKQKVPGRSAI